MALVMIAAVPYKMARGVTCSDHTGTHTCKCADSGGHWSLTCWVDKRRIGAVRCGSTSIFGMSRIS